MGLRLPLFIALMACLVITTASAIIVQPDKTEYLLGEPIELQVYTAGNATVQLIGNGSVVWEKEMNESGKLTIPTGSLSQGDYTIYAADNNGEVVKTIRIVGIKVSATLEIKSKVEGNLTLCGKTNLPEGYRLLIEVDGTKKEVKILGSSYCAKFGVYEGVYTARVIFGGKTLNESRVYVEGFKIRSVRFQPELYVGEPLDIKVSANLKGLDLKIVIYNNNTEKKLSKHVDGDSGEITFNAWLPPADYSVMILVIHGNSTDIMKLPLRIKKSFLSASVENFSDNRAVILAKAPISHVLWFISGSKVKKSIVGGERRTLVSIGVEGDEVLVLDQLNLSESEVLGMLSSGKIEVPHIKLNLQSLKVEKTPVEEKVVSEEVKETKEKENQNALNETENPYEGMFHRVNVVAAILTVLIVGGILAALVIMIRG